MRDTISARSVKPELGKARTWGAGGMEKGGGSQLFFFVLEVGGMQRKEAWGGVAGLWSWDRVDFRTLQSPGEVTPVCRLGEPGGCQWGLQRRCGLTSVRRLSCRSADRRSLSIFSIMLPRVQPPNTAFPYWYPTSCGKPKRGRKRPGGLALDGVDSHLEVLESGPRQ